MRYLFISGTDFAHRNLTGAHKRFIELVISLSKSNEVSLIAHPYTEFESENISFYPITEVIGRKLPNHISEQLTLTKSLKKYKRTIKYDYAIAFGQTTALCYVRAGYNNIVTLFREDLIGYQKAVGASALKIMYFWFQEHKTVKSSNKIIVQCEHDKMALISRHKAIEKKIFVQGNNINVSWIKNITKNTMNNPYPKLLFIGNFSSIRKGHQILLPAFKKITDDGIKAELIVIGGGKELARYKSDYHNYENIIFVGHTIDVSKYLRESDIEIVPSLIDSCPNTVLEGLKAGVAVYGSNTGGIPDLLMNSEYMFEADTFALYEFLKRKLRTKEYIEDQRKQQTLKQTLEFDWAGKIEEIIVGEI